MGKEFLYISRQGCTWLFPGKEEIKISSPFIIKDVKQNYIYDINGVYQDGYTFTIKETEQRCWVSYKWAMAENSPENIQRIVATWKAKDEVEEKQKIATKLFSEIKTLENSNLLEGN